MISKEFLQGRVDFFFHDYLKDDEFGKNTTITLPKNKGTTSPTKTFPIKALVTSLSQEDASRLSVNTSEYRTLDIYLEDLVALKTANPTAYIPYKNLQGIAQFTIDGAKYKVCEEKSDQQFEQSIRLICERTT